MIGSLRELLPPSELTQDLVQRALLVGWCIELVRRARLHIAANIERSHVFYGLYMYKLICESFFNSGHIHHNT